MSGRTSQFHKSCSSYSLALSLLLPLTGCSLTHFDDLSTASSALPRIGGSVHGGQQPISGASIQLFAANTTTNKGASTSLISPPVLTDANGNFNITGAYVCPTPNSLVYLTATGGNPGLGAGTNNSTIALMALLGTCSQFFTGGNSINLNVNELTTVAAVEALSSFMADSTHVGADVSVNPNALAGAFASANSIVNSFTGQFASPANGQALPAALYNTLADIQASCVNSSGNTGSTSNCGKIAGVTNSAADTISQLLYVVQHPAANVSTIYSLAAGGGVPFQPALSSQPADFSSSTVVTVPNDTGQTFYLPSYLTLDGAQNAWVATNSPGSAISSTQPSVFVFDNNLNLIHTVTVTGLVKRLATDPSGNVWVLTGSTTSGRLYKFDSNANLLVNGVSANSSGNVYPDGLQIAFDSTGNVWTASSEKSTTRPCAEKFSSAGVLLLSVCFNTSTTNPPGIAVDAASNAYLTASQPGVMFKMDSNGNVITTSPFSATGLALAGSAGAIHFDPAANRLVMYTNGASFAVFNTDGTTVTYPISNSFGLLAPVAFTLDGSGNIWWPNFSAKYTLGEATQAGVFLSPATITVSGFSPANLDDPYQIQVDANGNLFLLNHPLTGATTGSLVKIPGLATAKAQQNY